MDIDFVVLWVDGNDPAWRAEKAKYQGKTLDDSNSANRFRDWGLMPYWFRAVEKFTPWVRKVHFVTWGHLPPFLNTEHPKLHIVRHEDYLPEEYRPTFNANTLEMNLHRIPGLAEHFVYFNDDMFLLRLMPETSFFREGLPCTYGAEVPFAVTGEAGIWQHLILNDLRTINTHFCKREQVRKNAAKYRSRNYRIKTNIRTAAVELLFPENFLGFQNLHAPAAFTKHTFEEIWGKETALLQETSRHHFRTTEDVNQWLALWWQVASGQFAPMQVDNLVESVTGGSIDRLCRTIEGQTHDMICLNDPSEEISFEALSRRLKATFEKILPDKSGFERGTQKNEESTGQKGF